MLMVSKVTLEFMYPHRSFNMIHKDQINPHWILNLGIATGNLPMPTFAPTEQKNR